MLAAGDLRAERLWARLTGGLGGSLEENPGEEWEDLDEESLGDTDTDGERDPGRRLGRRLSVGEREENQERKKREGRTEGGRKESRRILYAYPKGFVGDEGDSGIQKNEHWGCIKG